MLSELAGVSYWREDFSDSGSTAAILSIPSTLKQLIRALSSALLAVFAFSQAVLAAEPTDTKSIVAAVSKIVNQCAKTALRDINDNAAILKCLTDEQKKYNKNEVKFPQEMFQAFVDPNDSFGSYDPEDRKEKWSSAALSLGNAENVALKVMFTLPLSHRVTMKEIKPAIVSETNKMKDFSKIFDANFVLDQQIGKQSVDGAAYLIKRDKGIFLNILSSLKKSHKVMKVVWADPSLHDDGQEFPREFLIQQHLEKLNTPNSNIVPSVITMGHSKITEKSVYKFDYLVMERLGSTASEHLYPKGAKQVQINPSIGAVELFDMSRRMYTVYKQIHRAGVAHLDPHLNNWAFTFDSKDAKQLMLFDFGRSRFMKSNYGLLLRDLFRWTQDSISLVTLVADRAKVEQVEMINEVAAIWENLQKLLAKLVWTPGIFDHPDVFAPFEDYALPSYDKMLEQPDFKAFIKAADAWETTDVTKWLPATSGNHRRKRASKTELSEIVKQWMKTVKPEKILARGSADSALPPPAVEQKTAPGTVKQY